jgi:predicted nucleic acid-binding Zn ribbon protein
MMKRPVSPSNPSLERAWRLARRNVLAEWRRVDLAPAERAWADASRPAANAVSRVLDRLRLEQRQSEVEIIKVWNRLLDPNVASHAQPVSFCKGTLFIAVDNSAWLSEIVRYRQRDILRRLQTSFGSDKIRKLSFRLG